MSEVPLYSPLQGHTLWFIRHLLTRNSLDVAEWNPTCRSTWIIRNSLPQDPAVGLCLGPYGGPRGGGTFQVRMKDSVASVLGAASS